MFRKIIIGIVLNAAALYAVLQIFPEITYTGGALFFVAGGVVLGLLNGIIKPILKLITFPFQILTLGLSLIVINGFMFWLFGKVLNSIALEGITLTVPAIKTYFLAGFVLGIVNWFIHLIFKS